jgi:hypothetical protein
MFSSCLGKRTYLSAQSPNLGKAAGYSIMINESERNKRRVRRAAALQARATISRERVSSLPSSMDKVATRWTERKDVLKNVSIYF